MSWIQHICLNGIVLASLLQVAGRADAQDGGVRGIVFDENDKPLEGVEVVIELEGGGRRYTAMTGKNGMFVKGGIRVGLYSVNYYKDGYEEVMSQVEVSFGKPQQLDPIKMARLPEGALTTRGAARAKGALDAAATAQKAGDIDATIKSLLDFIELVPDSAPAYFNLGAAYEKKGDKDNAIGNYNKAVELDPAMLDAWLALGDLYGSLKQWPEGMQALGKALEIKPDQPVVLFNYGAYAFNSGDMDKAQGAFEKLVESDPNNALGHYRLALTCVSQGKNDEAIDHIEKYLALEPEGAHAVAARNLREALKKG